MNKSTILTVKANAQLLIAQIDKVLSLSEEKIQARAKHNMNPNRYFTYSENPDYLISGTKEISALRRTSMELTRTLADLRQNR